MADTMDIGVVNRAKINPELHRLIIAARIVAYEDHGPKALKELDEAVEAFSEDVPWEETPEEDR